MQVFLHVWGFQETLPEMTASGMSFRDAAAYAGIGSSDYEAVTGKVWLNLPLN